MEETAIQSAVSKVGITTEPNLAPPTLDIAAPPRDVQRTTDGPIIQGLKFLAGLKLTVILLALSIALVFFGTLAQMDAGILAVLHDYFRTGIAWVPFQLFVRFGQIFLNVSPTLHVPGAFPYPGGWLLGTLLLANLVAAHALRFKVSWKRSGILLIHSGLILMMLGELVTGLFAGEARMTIWANGSSNFVESHDATELAIIDTSDPTTDEVVVVPQKLLRKGQVVSNPLLPFDVETVEYMFNSTEPQALRSGQPNRADAGEGKALQITALPVAGGAEQDKVDIASAYVTFKDKASGKSIGTYLVSLWFSHPLVMHRPQSITADGKTYTLFLRNKRTYKPYTIHLKEFRHDVYEGTTIPKNYSSLVRLVDTQRNEDREAKVYMNNPLRYEGETFYQSGFLPGDKGTILQVVRNPGWLMPYWSCVMVSLGMIVHFSIGLTGFLRKKMGAAIPVTEQAVAAKQTTPFLVTAFPWLVCGVAALYLVMAMLPGRSSGQGIDLDEFSRLPVLHGGRVKPIDTLARDSLMVISGQQTFLDAKGREQSAVKWFLDVLSPGHAGEQHKVFRIENDEVLALLGLERRPGLRYSIDEFRTKMDSMQREGDRIRQIDPKKRNTYEAKLIELAEHLQSYIHLNQMEEVLLLPPATADGNWRSLRPAVSQMFETGKDDPPARQMASMLVAYTQDRPDDFNKYLGEYRKYVDGGAPVDTARSNFEHWFNSFRPFLHCEILYLVVFLMACASWLGWSVPLRRAAFWLAILTLVVHGTAMLGRMYLMDRWLVFVTNLYSSAVFIGYVALVLTLTLEVIFPLGIATATGAIIGFLTTFLAHYLARSGDTLGMLQAVLDTNFWLATHVTCITFGYAATFVAGFLGIAYIGLKTTTRVLEDQNTAKALSLMIYGVLCFATLLSFTGTVLGGIWADQSWGRFWGWDPKENGALIIVLWNALILHARWGGLVKHMGMAVMAVVGNVVTGWSWFGTNQLGVGLHAYGFNNTLATGLMVFWFSQFVVVGVGIWLARQKPVGVQ